MAFFEARLDGRSQVQAQFGELVVVDGAGGVGELADGPGGLREGDDVAEAVAAGHQNVGRVRKTRRTAGAEFSVRPPDLVSARPRPLARATSGCQ